ncbi:MAG: flagellar export chaperone FliS [Chloroflexi bacterium]|nr:MAG: flagellar export chaperone FliS [Chloroflexota bacterium]
MQVLSAKPEKLILMLYDGALRFMKLGAEGIESRDFEKGSNNLIKAQRILVELMTCLDFPRGGDIASNLFRIYEFMHHSLVDANVRKDPAPIHKISEQLRTLRDSWEKAMKLQGVAGPPAPELDSPGKSAEQPVKRIEVRG